MDFGIYIKLVLQNEDGTESLGDIFTPADPIGVERTANLRTVSEGQDKVRFNLFASKDENSELLKHVGVANIGLGRSLPKGTLLECSFLVDESKRFYLTVFVPEFDIEEKLETDDPGFWPADLECGSEDIHYSMPELIEQLDSLIGLKEVKEQVRKRINQVEVEQKAREAGAQRIGGIGSLHMLFYGNPGTGKTTIARMLGKMYQELGVLPNGSKVVECTRGNLVGMYQGHSAKNVQDKFAEAEGGILFIDEAYSLSRDMNDSFGQETIDEIVAQMENHRDSVMVILAGYEHEMEEFLRKNPGLGSRIRNRIYFDDYSVNEMALIFKNFCRERRMNLEEGSDAVLEKLFEARVKQPDFGNARGVRNTFEEALEAQNERIMREISAGKQHDSPAYDTLKKEDLIAIAGDELDSEKTVEDILKEMSELVGLSDAKAKVQEMVDNIQVRQLMKQRGLSVPEDQGTLHLIFIGNAGTGKTSIARLLGEIYTKLGVLQKNVFVETGRAELVGQYQGHTAKLVINKLDEADGGILFIDEAYNLCNGDNDNFGQEAIQTLVAELENRRGHLMVILAGYPEKMKEFLKVNSGLASRLSNEVYFADYSLDELTRIFFVMAAKRGIITDMLDNNTVQKWIDSYRLTQKDFGNARGVRNLLDAAIRKKDSRIAALIRVGEELTDEAITTLTPEDLQ